MKAALSVAFGLILVAGTAAAHEVANSPHSHVYRQEGYGQIRQGHSVNGPQGGIVIWSPKRYSGYGAAPSVRFARPAPITRAPANPFLPSRPAKDPALQYGKPKKYGRP